MQASMELGPEDVSLLERCPHFRGWYVSPTLDSDHLSTRIFQASHLQD